MNNETDILHIETNTSDFYCNKFYIVQMTTTTILKQRTISDALLTLVVDSEQ